MESRVEVKILRQMQLHEIWIEREPIGWFRFEEAIQFDNLPEVFVRFVQQHLNKAECCKNSTSQILIIFKNEEDENRNVDPEITNWIESVCQMKPGPGEMEKIYFPRLWREYLKLTGNCFSCGNSLDFYGPCHYCKLDFIILEEMTHFRNAWVNWGNSFFISNAIATISSTGEINPEYRPKIYTKCTAIGERIDFLRRAVNQCNIFRTEGPGGVMIRTWNNLTTPLHYAVAARIRECKNRNAHPLLEELCLKKIFSLLERKNCVIIEECKELPLPQMIISKMMRIFESARYLLNVPNPAQDYVPRIRIEITGEHALEQCKLQ